MKEERLSIGSKELDLYIAKAKQLRGQEVSRIAGLVFRLPQRLILRALKKTNQAIDLDNKGDQSV